MEAWLIRIANYLLAQSWQIAVLTLVVACASFLLRNRSAHVRYLLWLIVLAKALVPPLYSIPVAVLPQRAAPEYILAPPVAERMAAEHEPVSRASRPRIAGRMPATRSALSPVGLNKPTRYNTRAWLAIGWLVGVVSLSFYYLANALRTQIWLQRRRKALQSESARDIKSFFTANGVRRMPNVWLLERINQPFVWGLVRGSIYLPAKLLDGKNAKFQPSLLGHELSHVIRLDAMVNSLQVIAQTIFWFHPFVWWANAKIRAEREKCCDEMTIARLKALPEEYGEAIVETLAAKYEQARPVPSLAVAGQIKNIEERIETMLKPGKKFYKRPSLIASTGVLLVTLLAVPTTVEVTAKEQSDVTSQPPSQRWTNSLGMVFVPVRGTEVWFCIWETRVKDFEAFIKATSRDMGNKMGRLNSEREGYNWKNPGFAQGPNHPVVGVNWNDAVAFCKWLTEKERKEGMLPHGQYRLPSDLEWSAAVGLIQQRGATPEERREKEGIYPWGKQWPPPKGAGNYADTTARKKYKPDDLPQTIEGYDDGYAETAPVGSFDPNPYGLYDLGGNVLEWCGYWWSDGAEELRPLRGASWFQGDQNTQGHVSSLLSNYRIGIPISRASSAGNRADCIGFRVVLGGH
jgi:beta-lactamase regulating signal transducer with metallopeptidase domain/formylglycine-generating enzyme required for sulfatase activity